MKSEITTAKIYQQFNLICKQLERSLIDQISPVFGFSSKDISHRIVQRFISSVLAEFVAFSAEKSGLENGVFSIGDLKFRNYAIKKIKDKYRISLNGLFFIRNFAEYFAFFFTGLAVFFLAPVLNGFKLKRKSTTILYGVGADSLDVKNQYKQFVEFCENSKITPLNRAHTLTIHTGLKLTPSSNGYLSFSRHPIHQLIIDNPPTFMEFLTVLGDFLLGLYLFFRASLKSPVLMALSRDIAFLPLVNYLSRINAIESIVYTNSNYDSQPLWFREFLGKTFNVHMVFYSQNTIPHIYSDFPVSVPIPNNVYLTADTFWVWTQTFENYLKGIGVKGEFKIVGPVLWYLDNPDFHETQKDRQVITVFDVTPMTEMHAAKLGLLDNYYNVTNCQKFINQIVSNVEKLNQQFNSKFELLLKHKRSYQDIHDHSYIDLITQLVHSNKLKLIEHNANLYELIQNSDLVIVIPYSSPALIAEYYKIPVIYFDPSESLSFDKDIWGNFDFIAGEPRLFEKMKKLLIDE